MIRAKKTSLLREVTTMRSTVTSTAPRMFTSRSWVMGRSGVIPVMRSAIALASLMPIQMGR